MGRYFFDVQETASFGDEHVIDTAGRDLPNDEAAREEAALIIAALAKQRMSRGAPETTLTIKVRTSSGRVVRQIAVTCTVEPEPATVH